MTGYLTNFKIILIDMRFRWERILVTNWKQKVCSFLKSWRAKNYFSWSVNSVQGISGLMHWMITHAVCQIHRLLVRHVSNWSQNLAVILFHLLSFFFDLILLSSNKIRLDEGQRRSLGWFEHRSVLSRSLRAGSHSEIQMYQIFKIIKVILFKMNFTIQYQY